MNISLTHQEQKIVDQLKQHVQQAMPPDPTGHDWPHVERVLKNAVFIAKQEGGDLFLISLIALTHDLYDHKFFNGSTGEAKEKLAVLLRKMGVEEKAVQTVVQDVFSLSFSKSVSQPVLSPEGKIVQDADRLEAIGAIGIARAFAYGGFKNRLMNHHASHANNAEKTGATFDHFFEKLLRLYDLFNTTAAKEMARDRFDFMQEFVRRFGEEWGSV